MHVRADLADLPLMGFIPTVSPRYGSPYHLSPMVAALETAPHAKGRYVISIPVRHTKTTTTLHAIAWMLMRNPRLEFIFATYQIAYAQKCSRECRAIALEAGIELDPKHQRLDGWRTTAGGGCLFTSVEGACTGYGCDVLIVDDPFQDRDEAERLPVREKRWEWLTDTAHSRLTVNGSAFIVASRWHVDDMSGRALKEGWTHVHMPAISIGPDGEERALWPDVRPLEHLREVRKVSPYNFESQYQGVPVARGATIFGSSVKSYYDAPGASGMRVAIGVDLAYSAGAKSDWTAIVVLGKLGSDYYVLHVERRQQILSEVERALRYVGTMFPAAMMGSYVAGIEARGPLELMSHRGILIQPMPARWNKQVRAERVSEAWRGGRILVPADRPWVRDFVQEITSFTGGPGDMNDDQVDALTAAFDMLAQSELGMSDQRYTFGTRAM